MQTIEKQYIEELYKLYGGRSEYLTEHLEYTFEDESRAVRAYKNACVMDEAIEQKIDEIGVQTDLPTAFFIKKLIDAIYPKSISRFTECCRICGIGVE